MSQPRCMSSSVGQVERNAHAWMEGTPLQGIIIQKVLPYAQKPHMQQAKAMSHEDILLRPENRNQQ